MSEKKRILLCNDAHYLYTGYAKYGKQFLSKLSDTGKYELAELACYGRANNKSHGNWRYYANHVEQNHPLYNEYKSNAQNEFGKWRFERVCLDFKPDIVCDIRDPWMLSFEHMSPLREFYHWAIMPTVDSAPQKDEWINMFENADGVFTYSDWGLKVLQEESNNTIKTIKSAPPGCDINTFKPVNDKSQHRSKMGFFKDAKILGVVMRNQSRKLYPDLFEAFRKFLDICYDKDNKDLAANAYLYVHCSYPDVGWEIPQLLREFGLGRKVIFSYICDKCKSTFCTFFRDAKTVCPSCNSLSAVLPNTVNGFTEKQLADVYNIFDVYIQYSVCEGFGMPQVEAGSCGVPIMSIDYSAMSDILSKTNGIKIETSRMFRDIGTHAYRALPDNNLCAKTIYDTLSLPSSILRLRGREARKAVEKYYNWDNTIKIWEDYFDSVELIGNQGRWNIPLRTNLINTPQSIWPEHLSNPQFINWCIINVMQEPRLLNSRFSMSLLRDLNYGFKPIDHKRSKPVTRQSVYELLLLYAQNRHDCELARTGNLVLENLDYIDKANNGVK